MMDFYFMLSYLNKVKYEKIKVAVLQIFPVVLLYSRSENTLLFLKTNK